MGEKIRYHDAFAPLEQIVLCDCESRKNLVETMNGVAETGAWNWRCLGSDL